MRLVNSSSVFAESIDDPTVMPGHDATATGREDCVIDEVAVARAAERRGAAGSLTATEREAVLRVMASRGASDAQIAEHLGVVDRTILRWRTQLQIPAAGRPRACPETDSWVDAEAREVTARPRRRPAPGRGEGRAMDRGARPGR